MHIAMGAGVCGTAAATKETVVVDDVHQFNGYIACDSDAQSELVIPLIKNGQVKGVFDLDAPVLGRFADPAIVDELETFCQELIKTID